MRKLALTLILFCIGYSGSCNKTPKQAGPYLYQKLSKQKFLFERSYTNFAWGYSHEGIYIDNQGNVYTYAYQRGEKPWSPQQPDSYTEQELEQRYNHGRKLLMTIDTTELLEKYQLIEEASKGGYSKREQKGADQGGRGSSCYEYDEATGRYKEIELRVKGDWNYENLSPAARELADWLESLKATVN